MLYVEQVQSSLKKGCNVRLGQHTVICGPNGGGKSTIVQSIELATNGWVSDMEGRARVKLPTALARLFPPDVDKYSKATLSDGTIFSWALEEGAKDGSFKRPDHSAAYNVRWPVQDLMDVLRGDASTVGVWLEQQVVGTPTREDLLGALPPAVREIVGEFVKRRHKLDFIALAKEAKQEATTLRTQATRSERTIDSMTVGIAPPLLDSVRQELEDKLIGPAVAVQVGVTPAEHEAARKAIEQQAELYAAKLNKLNALAPLSEEVGHALTRLTAAGELIKQHTMVFGKEECWVCGNEEHGAVGQQIERLTAAMSQLHPQYVEGMQRQLAFQEVAMLEKELETKVEAFKRLHVVVPVDDTERRALMAKLAADDAARRTWNNADASRKEIDQLRSKADLLTLAGNALEKAGRQFLVQRKQHFEDSVSNFLPEGERVGVDLGSSRFGLIRDGELHSALSGAEWSRVLLALATAQESHTKLPCILVPEDRAWDAQTLAGVMAALAAAPVQIIIMSTVQPEPVEGWTLVNV
jgi:energy-coupling factor transporter ATP-binding protein EcfA2